MLSWPPQTPWCHFDATSPGRQSGSQGKPNCWCYHPPCSQAHTAHGKGGQWCVSHYQQGWEVKMQTSSFGAFLAGHVGKSSGFYIPADQEMLSTGRASPLPLLRKGKIPPPLAVSVGSVPKQAQSTRYLQSAGASLQNKDKPCHTSPQGDNAHTSQQWHHKKRPATQALDPPESSWCSQGMRAGSLGHLSVTVLAHTRHMRTAGGAAERREEGAGFI